MLEIGKVQDSDDYYLINMATTHRILVCGKTGSGKSYTMGVIIEELSKIDDLIKLVIDSQGIFWSFTEPNLAQESELWAWNLNPKGLSVRLLVPGDPVENYGGEDVVSELQRRGVEIVPIRVNPSDVSPEMWCDLFNLDINELRGITLYNAVRACKRKFQNNYFISEIINEVENDTRAIDQTKAAVIRNLNMAEDWEVFEKYSYNEIWDLLDTKKINVVDLSVKDQSRYGIRTLIVGILSQLIFKHRTKAKRRELLGLGTQMPNVLMAVDEAQNYCPAGKSTLAKDILIKWAKEGRQPGLSLMVVSQQPSAIDPEILSQCDIKIIHKITSTADRKAIDALSEDYIGSEVSTYIRKLPNNKVAVVLDDNIEALKLVEIRPRMSLHAG
jgi:DNA helicase HerA-like ATPase